MHTECRVAYLAGFFDGEGHIRIQKHSSRGSYMLSISCVQATPYPLDMYVEEFGGVVKVRDYLYRGIIKRKYEWRTSSMSAQKALEKMMPFLVAKKDEAEVAIKFRNTFRPQYGDRSKMSEDIILSRQAMMYDLQEMRKIKRKVD